MRLSGIGRDGTIGQQQVDCCRIISKVVLCTETCDIYGSGFELDKFLFSEYGKFICKTVITKIVFHKQNITIIIIICLATGRVAIV